MELRKTIQEIVFAAFKDFPYVRPWHIEETVDRIMIEVENYAGEEEARRENEKGTGQRELPLHFKR